VTSNSKTTMPDLQPYPCTEICKHLWPSSKSKFNLKSNRVNLVASASAIECLLYLPYVPSIQYIHRDRNASVDPARKFKCTTSARVRRVHKELKGTVVKSGIALSSWRGTWIYAYSPFKVILLNFCYIIPAEDLAVLLSTSAVLKHEK